MLTDKQLKAAKIEPERLRARTELLVALAKTSDGAESLPDALPPVADGLDPVSVTRAAKAGLLEGAAECALLMLPEDNAQTLLVLPEENAQDGVGSGSGSWARVRGGRARLRFSAHRYLFERAISKSAASGRRADTYR